MNANTAIRLAGQPCTIIRNGGNVSTYCIGFSVDSTMVARRRLEPLYDYEFGFAFTTDSTIASGDLVQIGNSYFLAAGVAEQNLYGSLLEYRCTMWKCNAAVTIYDYNESTRKHSTVVNTNVPCLFRSSMDRPWVTDRAAILKSGSRVDPSELVIQKISGLTSKCIARDVANQRWFRIGDYIEHFIAENLLVAQVVWER